MINEINYDCSVVKKLAVKILENLLCLFNALTMQVHVSYIMTAISFFVGSRKTVVFDLELAKDWLKENVFDVEII